MVRNKKKKKHPRHRPSAIASPRPTTQPARESDQATGVPFQTVFGTINVPPDVAAQLGREAECPDESDETDLLDLTDCRPRFTFLSPLLARLALIDAERLDPTVADELARAMPGIVPALAIHGERGRLLCVAPTLRRVRRVSLYSGDTHSALMGMIYGLPRACLAEFANGAEAESAAEELAERSEMWDGRLFILLVTDPPDPTRNTGIEAGQFIAAHEVILERPVLWHRGER